jgi:hypothetical protein
MGLNKYYIDRGHEFVSGRPAGFDVGFSMLQNKGVVEPYGTFVPAVLASPSPLC